MKILLLITLLGFSISTVQSQITINEVMLGNRYLELQNIADTTVNISQYYLVVNNQIIRIGTHFPICQGVNLAVEPGEYFGWDIYSDTDTVDGEVVLFNSNATNDPAAAIDYVQWGSASHPYEALADSANLWSSGDFVTVVLNGGSLERISPGAQSSDWTNVAVNSLCEENGTGCETIPFTEIPGSVPFLACLGGSGNSYFGYTFHGNTFEDLVTMVLDGNNRILGFSNTKIGSTINLQWLTPADTNGIHSRFMGHHGPIGNLEVGKNLTDLIGCFYYSGPHDTDVYFLEEGMLSAEYIDSVYTDVIELCAADSIPDIIRFSNSASGYDRAFVAYNDINNRIIAIEKDSMILDLTGTSFTDIVVFSFTYQDSLEGEIGDFFGDGSGYPCDVNAANEIIIKTDLCISSSADINNDQQGFLLSPNPASDLLLLSQLPGATSEIEIFNTWGQLLLRQKVGDASLPVELDVSSLPDGMYLLFVKGKGFNLPRFFVRA